MARNFIISADGIRSADPASADQLRDLSKQVEQLTRTVSAQRSHDAADRVRERTLDAILRRKPAKSPESDEPLRRADVKKLTAALEAAQRGVAATGPGSEACPVCKKSFYPKSLRQKNCSMRCTKRASKERCTPKKATLGDA